MKGNELDNLSSAISRMGVQKPKKNFQEIDPRSFLSTRADEEQYLHDYRAGLIKKGLKTGYSDIDQHFRVCPAHLVVFNGHNGIGKSTVVWYLAAITNLLHGWKWVIYSPENEPRQVRRSFMEFRMGKNYKDFNNLEVEVAQDWAYNNFEIIRNDFALTGFNLVSMFKLLNIGGQYNGIIIDPYNSLDIDVKGTGCFSMDDYHNKVINLFKLMTKQDNVAVWVSTHANTSALRNTKNDMPLPPSIGDVEYGAKWGNRCDEFITIHRYAQDPLLSRISELHIRKFKDYDLGGKPTYYDHPVKLEMGGIKSHGFYGFYNYLNENPIRQLDNPVQAELNHIHAIRDGSPF